MTLVPKVQGRKGSPEGRPWALAVLRSVAQQVMGPVTSGRSFPLDGEAAPRSREADEGGG